jgi:protein ImuA
MSVPAPLHPDPAESEVLPADVWHASALAPAPLQVLATGDAELDAQLPGGGWPVGALTEIIQPAGVHSEWRLLLPSLARSGCGAVVLVGAPLAPFAPMLEAQGLSMSRLLWVTAQAAGAQLWTAEQALRCAGVDAVLLWLSAQRVRTDQLRRLHMAAASHHKLLFLMRSQAALHEASPAVLRLQVTPAPDDRLQVQILKRRGPPLAQVLHLSARPAPLAILLAAGQRHYSNVPDQGHVLDRAAA